MDEEEYPYHMECSCNDSMCTYVNDIDKIAKKEDLAEARLFPPYEDLETIKDMQEDAEYDKIMEENAATMEENAATMEENAATMEENAATMEENAAIDYAWLNDQKEDEDEDEDEELENSHIIDEIPEEILDAARKAGLELSALVEYRLSRMTNIHAMESFEIKYDVYKEIELAKIESECSIEIENINLSKHLANTKRDIANRRDAERSCFRNRAASTMSISATIFGIVYVIVRALPTIFLAT